jgi:phosphate-selective porin OprO/OprP
LKEDDEVRKNGWSRAFAGLAFVVVAILAVSAPGAYAQTSEEYYQEVRIEDRIYVFSTEKKYTAYQQSKDMGVSITRLGYGPNGETVVFEDAKAVDLYNKKYGKTEAPPAEIKTPDIKLPFGVQYRNPGLRLSFPKAEINLSHRIQVRYTHEQFDDIRNPPDPLPTALEDRGSFRVRRMKTKFDGWIYSKNLTYELQANWVASGQPNQILEDAVIDYDFTHGKRAFRLRGGQYKAAFGRQELTSSGSQQFVDRGITNTFAPARQIGLQAWGQAGSQTVADLVEWRAGIYNGNGVNQTSNDNDKYLFASRIMISPWGNVGYSESNLEGYDFRLSFAGEYLSNDQIVQPATGAATGTDDETFGVDVVLKAFKSLSIFGAYYDGQRENPAGAETDRDGWIAQVGWLVTPKWEIAGRLAEVDPNSNTDDNSQKEWRAGVSWYMSKHNWKIQADYGETENEAAAATTNRKLKELRVQAQLIF